jgi:D-alanine-D-alanine ligase
MSCHKKPEDLPVILLYNMDPAWSPSESEEAVKSTINFITALRGVGHPVTPVEVRASDLTTLLNVYSPDEFIVFNWCEAIPGIHRSEGLAAEVLESLNYVFTGSDSRTLKVSENKRLVKDLLSSYGIPTPRYRFFDRPETDGWDIFPAIVKPALEHCSLGITEEAVVLTEEALRDRIAWLVETFRQPALVEDFIDGREFRLSLLGNGEMEILPPVEMGYSAFSDLRQRLCSYDAKFTPGSDHYTMIETLLPAPLDKREYEQLVKVCTDAYRAMGLRDYGRLDLRLREGVFYLLDVNPNPDISADASMAYAAEYAGYSYGALGNRIVRLAAERHPLFRAGGLA